MTNRIVEIIHGNSDMRSYAVSCSFDVPKNNYMLTPDSDVPETLKPLLDALWALPTVKDISVARYEVRIEATSAWTDCWDEISPTFVELINNHFFPDGEETDIQVRDESQKYSRASRDDY